ncbi:MAG TPA: NINE protein [Verrucomicrobiae bacterium]|nr:NINE protein [Verrucomicrobiae bacterium]
MYKIIGADGREYVPTSVEQLRHWIADGRANAQTKAQAEGSTEWKTLADFPEFHAALGISVGAPPPISPPVQTQTVTRLPGADRKIIAGVLALIPHTGCLGIHKFVLGNTGAGIAMLLITVLTCGIGGAVMWIIALIEGLIYLTRTDEEFVQTYIVNKKAWF